MTVSGVAVSWPSTSIGPPGAAIEHRAVARDGESLFGAGRRGAAEHAHRLGLIKLHLAALEPAAHGSEAVIALGQQRLDAGGIAVGFFAEDGRVGRAGLVPGQQLAGLAALDIAHGDRIAGLDLDQHRAVALDRIALHARRQRDLAGPQDRGSVAAVRLSLCRVGRLAHLSLAVRETSLPVCKIILAARIGSGIAIWQGEGRTLPFSPCGRRCRRRRRMRGVRSGAQRRCSSWNTPHPISRCAPIHLLPQGEKEEARTSATPNPRNARSPHHTPPPNPASCATGSRQKSQTPER